MAFEREKVFEIAYRGVRVGRYVADVVVEQQLVVEIKALRQLAPEHEAQVINYLRASGLSVGLLLNFGRPKVQVRRIVWGHDDSSPI